MGGRDLTPNNKNFITCEACGKTLIEKREDGMFRFRFGSGRDGMQEPSSQGPPVDMIIHGSIKMRCWHKKCRAWNTVNYLE